MGARPVQRRNAADSLGRLSRSTVARSAAGGSHDTLLGRLLKQGGTDLGQRQKPPALYVFKFHLSGPVTEEPACDPDVAPWLLQPELIQISYANDAGGAEITISGLHEDIAGPYEGATRFEVPDDAEPIERGTAVFPEVTTPDEESEGLVVTIVTVIR